MPTSSTPDFSQFKLRVNIKASVQAAYNAWATAAGLESWFLRKAIFHDEKGNTRNANSAIQSNDSYAMYWHGYPDEVVKKGKVVKANGKDQFTFTFTENCPVSITISTEENETIVELFESELPTDTTMPGKHFTGDSRGWIFYLANLKSVLEGGLDLRNKNEKIVNVITA